MTFAEASAKRPTPAGLAWVLHLTFLGMEDAIVISKVITWGWMLYIVLGTTLTALHIFDEIIVDWLLSFYFTIYSILGLLWHLREVHLGRLRMMHAATDIEEGLLSNTQTPHTGKPCEACKKHSEAPVGTGTSSSTCAGYSHTLGWWLLNLGFLGFKNTDWMGKLLWWMSALEVILGARSTISCTHTFWGPPPACSAGDQLYGLYFALYGLMLLLSTSRSLEIQRRRAAEGPMTLSSDAKKPAEVAPTAASTSTADAASGYSTLGWILNLGMLGHEGAIALTKIYYWVQLIVLVSFVAMCIAFRHLPGAQWVWTLDAVLGATMGLTGISLMVQVMRSHGHIYY